MVLACQASEVQGFVVMWGGPACQNVKDHGAEESVMGQLGELGLRISASVPPW